MENKTNKRFFLDVHAIQTVPPSNINRDDTGSPKTAQYGGVTRARVSSQSWKSAMRKYFIEKGQEIGIRTLKLVEVIARKVVETYESINIEDAILLSKKLLDNFTYKDNNKIKRYFEYDKDLKINALFFISQKQLESLATLAINEDYNKEKIVEAFNAFPGIDTALFGRMLATNPILNEDASAQVAHAISTHAIESEFDFFTAVDDLLPEDSAGAGMLGTIEYNSSTLYRYANIAIHEFEKQLEDKESTINAIKLFVEAFINSMPTGKINTFANQTLPQAVIVSLREDRPVNMVSAFEKPIKSNDGYVEKSIEKLFEEYEKYDKFTKKPIFTAYLLLDDIEVNEIGKVENNAELLLEDLGSKLEEIIKE